MQSVVKTCCKEQKEKPLNNTLAHGQMGNFDDKISNLCSGDKQAKVSRKIVEANSSRKNADEKVVNEVNPSRKNSKDAIVDIGDENVKNSFLWVTLPNHHFNQTNFTKNTGYKNIIHSILKDAIDDKHCYTNKQLSTVSRANTSLI